MGAEMSRPWHRCGRGQHFSFRKKSASFGFGPDEASRDSFREASPSEHLSVTSTYFRRLVGVQT